MTIIGIGTDIVHVPRIERIYVRNKKNFIRRICSQEEQDLFMNHKQPTAFLAKRFAAKEALVKALGRGFRDNILFTDMSIINDKYGKPIVNWYGAALDYINKLAVSKTELSITDEKQYALAFAVLT